MLAIDYVPTLTNEVMSRCRDTTIEELYEERRLLISRLLRCKPTDSACSKSQTEEIDAVRYNVRKMGQELSPSCPELHKRTSLSSEDLKTNHFIRATPSKDKTDSKQGNRDSGFSERSYASSSDESYTSDHSIESRQLPINVGPLNEIKPATRQSCDKPAQQQQHSKQPSDSTPAQHSSSQHQHFTSQPATSQNSGQVYANNNVTKSHRDSDNESVVSSQTLTDSQGTDRSVPDGLRVATNHKSSRSARSVRYAHQDSMFGVMTRSMLYFPKHRRKANLIRTKLSL